MTENLGAKSDLDITPLESTMYQCTSCYHSFFPSTRLERWLRLGSSGYTNTVRLSDLVQFPNTYWPASVPPVPVLNVTASTVPPGRSRAGWRTFHQIVRLSHLIPRVLSFPTPPHYISNLFFPLYKYGHLSVVLHNLYSLSLHWTTLHRNLTSNDTKLIQGYG